MENNVLKVKKLRPDAFLPRYQTKGATCFDLHALIDPGMPFIVSGRNASHPGAGPVTFHTGLAFEVPKDWTMLIFSRSGHGFKDDLRLANCVGVIDSDYRGEVQVKLTCDDLVGVKEIKHGDRIAQAVLVYAPQVEIAEVEELSSTERGEGGMGSTGTQ